MTDRNLIVLAQDVQTETDRLRELFAALVGLEKMVTGAGTGPLQALENGELSALFKLVNEGMERQVEAIENGLQAMLESLLAPSAPAH